MELGLSLGEASSKPFFLAEKTGKNGGRGLLGLGFCMGLGVGSRQDEEEEERATQREGTEEREEDDRRSSADPPVQLDLLPFSPVLHLGFPWSAENGNSEGSNRGLDVNRMPSTEEMEEAAAVSSSPNSTVSSFQMDFSTFRSGGGGGFGGGRNEGEAERASSRASDDEDNGLTRKKLRLSKEQSAYLEESFKEHNTLNPKQKLALAKQLNLRPRQVEVWFQNRRARTKLKQTEVDCEYLKRCCEKLTEENRRLQKELQELRALKTSHPFYMQLPATTLTMCPSCERVATNTTTPSSGAPPAAADHVPTGKASSTSHNPSGFPSLAAARPRFYPFAAQQPQPPHQPSAAS